MKRMFALIAVLALVVAFTMPVTSAVAGSKAKSANPCATKAMNPCNPCAQKAKKAMNPCNPCAQKAKKAMNPCNPCNPCATKAKTK